MTRHLTRHTATVGGEVTVFLIGMRFNALHRADRWGPVLLAMPRMLRQLEAMPEAGLLGHDQWLGRTTLLLSYWRSPEHLQRFAADPQGPHLQPWRDFRALGAEGHVGVWHETYRVSAGQREAVYVNMPPTFGLAGALGAVDVTAGLRTAAQRMRAGGVTAG